MNKTVLIVGLALVVPLIAVLAMSFGRDPHVVRSPLVGRPAPAFTLATVDDAEPVSLSELRGKPVVLNFWATWCGPCAQEHGVLTAAARRAGDAVQFLGVVYEDTRENILDYLERSGSEYPTLVDVAGRTAIAYGVYGVPETYFIDAGGKVVDKHVGPLTPPVLQQYLRELQASQ